MENEELVSISFHSISKSKRENKLEKEVAFTDEEYKKMYELLEKYPSLFKNDEEFNLAKKDKKAVNIIKIEKDSNFIYGIFEPGYSGHGYRVEKKVTKVNVEENDISYRPFFFMTYLSKSGKIYLGVQYLGNYGSYQSMRRTIYHCLREIIKDRKYSLSSTAYNDLFYNLDDINPKKVKLSLFNKFPDDFEDSKPKTVDAYTMSRPYNDDSFGKDIRRDFAEN